MWGQIERRKQNELPTIKVRGKESFHSFIPYCTSTSERKRGKTVNVRNSMMIFSGIIAQNPNQQSKCYTISS